MGIKLLVVEDNAMVREGLSLLLACAKIEVVEAETGAAALRMAAAHDIDAVLLDIKLADADGLDVLVDLKTERPNLPVLVHSQHDALRYLKRSFALGASGYLVKGLDRKHLIDAIHRVVSGDQVWSTDQVDVIWRSATALNCT